MEQSRSRFFSEGVIVLLYVFFVLGIGVTLLCFISQSRPGAQLACWLSAISCTVGLMGAFVLMRRDEAVHKKELSLARAQQDERKEEAIRAIREKFPDSWQQVLSGLDPYLTPRGALSPADAGSGEVSISDSRGALSQVEAKAEGAPFVEKRRRGGVKYC